MSSPGGVQSHLLASAASDTITVDITDGTGFFAAAGSLPVTVKNAATIALSGNPNANAGGVYTLNLGAVNDPGQTVTQYTVNWGDNQVSTSQVGGAITHTYNSPGSDLISVSLTDNSGATSPAAGTLPVTVGTPSVNLTGNSAIFSGQTYNLTINPANDPGGTPLQYVVNWGDGSNTTYNANGNSPIPASHPYSAAQHVIITTDLIDNTGTFLSAGSLALNIAPPPTVAVLSGSPGWWR